MFISVDLQITTLRNVSSADKAEANLTVDSPPRNKTIENETNFYPIQQLVPGSRSMETSKTLRRETIRGSYPRQLLKEKANPSLPNFRYFLPYEAALYV